MPRTKTAKKPRKRARRKPPTTDRHILYQLAVQAVEPEIDFVDQTYRKLRRRKATRLREDFCGTAATACEWVRRRPSNIAIGLDLDQPTLDWGLANNVAKLKPQQRKRVKLLNRNVCDPGPGTRRMDCILAMNFSYWILSTRPLLLSYFREVRKSLAPDGLFFLDFYGGWETTRPQKDRRPIDGENGRRSDFTYIWDQDHYDPATGMARNYIHFRLSDGTYMRKAFSYTWRVWTLPEIREILEEAGFRKVTVYWEGDDEDGEGDGNFEPAETAEQCPAYICYIVAEK